MFITNFKPVLMFRGNDAEKVSAPKLQYPPVNASITSHGGGGGTY